MTHTLTPPAHQHGNGRFGRPAEEPTVSFRPRPRFAPAPVWGPPGPIPPMAPPQPRPWGVPNAWTPPAPWGMPPAGGQNPKTQRWLLAVAGAAVAVATITVAVAASTPTHNSPAVPGGVPVPTPPTKSSAAPVPSTPVAPPHVTAISDSALPMLLPDPAYVAQVMGTTGLEAIDKLSGPGMFTDVADPAKCVGVVIPANENAYAGSGSRATYVQALHDQGRTATALSAVTTFGTASSATDLVAAQGATWATCQSAPVVLNPSHPDPMSWTVQDVSVHRGIITARISAAGGPTCQRALTSNNNVVVDVTACNANPSNEAETIASTIAKRAAQ